MTKYSCFAAVVFFAVWALIAPAAVEAQLFTVNVSGQVNWTDGQSLLHAARLDNIQIVGTNPISGLFVAATGTTDLQGNYSVTFNSNLPAGNTYQLQVFPSNVGGFVSTDGTAANTYTIPTPTFGLNSGNNTVNFNVPNNSDAQTQSLAVADAILTGYQFGNDARGAAPAAIGVSFYDAGGTVFSPSKTIIKSLSTDAFDFDVNEHEYGHYLQQLDNLANNPGGSHSWGTTNIGLVQQLTKTTTRTLTKLQGVQLAWGEGAATYIGIASQWNKPATYNFPGTVQNVGDRYYDDFSEVDGRGNTVNSFDGLANFDSAVQVAGGSFVHTNVPGQGEGDEAPVARILWALGDPAMPAMNPSWSRVSRGFTQVYKDMQATAAANGGTVQTLSQLNSYYLNTIATNDKQRTDYGAIFQHYGVSANPNGAMAASPTLSNTDPAPTFTWDAGNNGANDTFKLTIWDSAALTSRILDMFTVPAADGTSYTLTPAQWALIDSTLGTKEFVITASDLMDPGGNAYTGLSATGAYWSDAYSFSVVPEPSTLALLTLGGLIAFAAKRREIDCCPLERKCIPGR
jgi:hypothetical protein